MSDVNTSDVPDSLLPTVLLDRPSARELAGYVAVYQDLMFVAACCKKLTELLDETEPPDGLVVAALWSTAVIAYARCFKDGQRKFRPQTADVSALPLEGDVVEFHDLILTLRDKHVAHSVNPFEQVVVGAVLSDPESPARQVEGISLLSMRLMSHDRQGVWQLGKLAHEMARTVQKTIEKKQSEILVELQSLDVDDLYELPPLRAEAPAPQAARQPRS